MRPLSQAIAVIFFVVSSLAFVPSASAVDTVYRADFRNPERIQQAGGMFPRARQAAQADFDLVSHVEGRSVDNHTTGLVSTSFSLQGALYYASLMSSLDLSMGGQGGPIYIYEIRPSENFYDVGNSLGLALNETNDAERRSRLLQLAIQNKDVEEVVAMRGIRNSLILRSTALTTVELRRARDENQRLGQAIEISSDSARWTGNPNFSDYGITGVINRAPYPGNLGEPSGYLETIPIDQAAPDSGRLSLLINLGVAMCMFGNHGGGPRFLASRPVEQMLSLRSEESCPALGKMAPRMVAYDLTIADGLLVTLLAHPAFHDNRTPD